MAVETPRADASGSVRSVDAASAGRSEAAVVAAEAEDALTAAFGPVSRWWVGELPGLGVMRLPLP